MTEVKKKNWFVEHPNLTVYGIAGTLAAGVIGYCLLNPNPGPVQKYETFTQMFLDQKPHEFRPGTANRWEQVHYDWLTNTGSCENREVDGITRDTTALLVDYNGRVVSRLYKDGPSEDDERERLFEEGITDIIPAPTPQSKGYPYWFSCNGNEDALEERLDWVLDKTIESGTKWKQEGKKLWNDTSLDAALHIATKSLGGNHGDSRTLAGIAFTEYGFKTSDAGAYGIMQIMPTHIPKCELTFNEEGQLTTNALGQAFCAARLFHIKERDVGRWASQNEEGKPQKLSNNLKRNLAALAYNAGTGNVREIIQSESFDYFHDRRDRWYTFGLGYSDEDIVVASAFANYGQGPVQGQKIGQDVTQYFPKVLAGETLVNENRSIWDNLWRRTAKLF